MGKMKIEKKDLDSVSGGVYVENVDGNRTINNGVVFRVDKDGYIISSSGMDLGSMDSAFKKDGVTYNADSNSITLDLDKANYKGKNESFDQVLSDMNGS